MIDNNRHYRQLVCSKTSSRFASCGYKDRFDPFTLCERPRVRALYQSVFSLLPEGVDRKRILDIGCGTGIYFPQLAACAREVHVIDFSPEMVSIAANFIRSRNLSGFFAHVGSAEALPWGPESFDVVAAMDVLHHVPDVSAAVREVSRVLKPGGLFLVFEPNILNPLMLLAHLIPSEERLALRRNTPKKLDALVSEHFQLRRWKGICELVTQSQHPKKALLDCYLALSRIAPSHFWPRQVCLFEKLT